MVNNQVERKNTDVSLSRQEKVQDSRQKVQKITVTGAREFASIYYGVITNNREKKARINTRREENVVLGTKYNEIERATS